MLVPFACSFLCLLTLQSRCSVVLLRQSIPHSLYPSVTCVTPGITSGALKQEGTDCIHFGAEQTPTWGSETDLSRRRSLRMTPCCLLQ